MSQTIFNEATILPFSFILPLSILMIVPSAFPSSSTLLSENFASKNKNPKVNDIHVKLHTAMPDENGTLSK